MNEGKLAETLAKIDESLLADDGLRSTVNADAIRKLHLRRRSRNRSIAAVSIGFGMILSAVVFRSVQERDDHRRPTRTVPIVSNERKIHKTPEKPAESASKSDFELARLANPSMNLELELVRESIADSLVKLARLRKDGGIPESDWRQDLDFVLKNYPGTIAAETARNEFGTGSE